EIAWPTPFGTGPFSLASHPDLRYPFSQKPGPAASAGHHFLDPARCPMSPRGVQEQLSRRWRRMAGLVLVAVVTGAAPVAGQAPAGDKQKADEVEGLKKQLKSLQAEVEDLKKQLEQARSETKLE